MIRLSAVGDVINVLPSVTLLRRSCPDAHLAFAVEDRAAAVVRGHPMLDDVIVFPRRRWREMLVSASPRRWRELASEVAAHRRRLRASEYDVALDFQGNLKGALYALASGAPRRIGFARGHDREGNHWFSTEGVTPPADRPHRVEKFAALLGPLGVHTAEREYVLPTDDAATARIEAWLTATGLAGRDRGEAGRSGTGPPVSGPVVLHPGTSDRGAGKRWPPERYGELARRIRSELGLVCVVTWGPGEEDLAGSVRAVAGDAAIVGPRTDSLLELAALLRRAVIFVSADTGPMHLAAACGTPCVALFGPKDPAIYRPWGENHVVLRGEVGGGGRPTMQAIAVEDVFRAVAARLARP